MTTVVLFPTAPAGPGQAAAAANPQSRASRAGRIPDIVLGARALFFANAF